MVTALVRSHIRLGFYPEHWKTARGITIPKPGKDNYSQAKAYRVISLLDCLGKVVEKRRHTSSATNARGQVLLIELFVVNHVIAPACGDAGER